MKLDRSHFVTLTLSSLLGILVSGCLQAPGGPEAEPQDPEDVGVASAAVTSGKGMSWVWKTRIQDVDEVGSDATTNPYSGDQTCSITSLPILCLRPSDLPVPSYVTSAVNVYNGWSGSYIGVTRQHLGTDMTSRSVADGLCAAELGPGWRMAEFHDGVSGGGTNGWNFMAYGAAPEAERFWAAIKDQPANCWN